MSTFVLDPKDEEFIKEAGFQYETLLENQKRWLILKDFPLPKGYNLEKADVAILILPSYPNCNYDMSWFYPHLSRIDGAPIRQINHYDEIKGVQFQRWSRHRDIHSTDLAGHIYDIKNWLEKEFRIRPRNDKN